MSVLLVGRFLSFAAVQADEALRQPFVAVIFVGRSRSLAAVQADAALRQPFVVAIFVRRSRSLAAFRVDEALRQQSATEFFVERPPPLDKKIRRWTVLSAVVCSGAPNFGTQSLRSKSLT